MQKRRHYSIPVFIPELACPHQCVFCNQRKISGQLQTPSIPEIHETIEQYLSTIDTKNSDVEIAFFGGNFTGIPIDEQEKYLSEVQPYFEKGLKSIRLSTRPDYISQNILDLLKKYRVGTIELGAQSMVEEVLQLSGRGHTVRDTKDASKLILQNGFELGLQMMIGLPGDTVERSILTAKKITALRASSTRIYPTVVIKDTVLEDMYTAGRFIPLTIDEAVAWTKEIYKVFELNSINILRVGLHPSEGLLNKTELVAGPFHPSFRELVLSELWGEKLASIKPYGNKNVGISVPVGQINFAIGYNSKNKTKLLKLFSTVKFTENPELTGREFDVNYS